MMPMLIEVIGSNTVKIVLNQYDMTDYDICFDRLSCKDPDTKRLLIELLQLVRVQKNIDLCTQKLYIEAFPCNDGGCMLYISPIDDTDIESVHHITKSPYTSMICECDSLDALTALSRHLHKMHSHMIYNAELFASNGKYRLLLFIFNKLEDKIQPTVNEYAKIIGMGDIQCAKTREHFKCLVDNNALELIVKTLA